MQFKQGIGWKACYDDERNLYTAKRSWRGDYHLYEINEAIYSQLGMPDTDADELISSGRHLYYRGDNSIGPCTAMVIDDRYAELCPWAELPECERTMSKELTDVAVELWENDETREQRRNQG